MAEVTGLDVPSPRGDGNSSKETCSAIASGVPVADARPWKKNAPSDRRDRAVDEGGHRRGSHHRHQVDPQTTDKISRQLRRAGIRVCGNTVGRLLKRLDFALHVNKKTISSGSGVDRDRQFRVFPVGPEAIRAPRAAHHQRGHEEARDDRVVQESGPSGPRLPPRCTTTTSEQTPRAWPSPTASTTRKPTTALSSLALPMTLPISPAMPSVAGGSATNATATPGPGASSSWPIAAEATETEPPPGSAPSRPGSATTLVSPSPSPTIPQDLQVESHRAPAFSAKSRRTGPDTHSPATRPCSSTSAPLAQKTSGATARCPLGTTPSDLLVKCRLVLAWALSVRRERVPRRPLVRVSVSVGLKTPA